MNQIDARGYSCPEPVLMTKQALKKYGVPLQVLVDGETPLENVTRLATNGGYKVSHREVDRDYEITIS